ncbi:MAG: DUF4870 domain-containing protein [Candidatus Kapaibacteriota bacterium]|jgi:uncharacterized Tic20 family protein
MNSPTAFPYKPNDRETEEASNSYLMSLVALIAGLPLPIINLIATVIFYLTNRKGTYFVRWHCTQALLSQFSLFAMNVCAVWWTLSIIFSTTLVSNGFIAYLITIIVVNVVELTATIYTAIHTRKGRHVQWWFYGSLTNLICREQR